MTPLLDLFTTWAFRPEVLIVPILLAALYLRGWLHLSKIEDARPTRGAARPRLTNPWRLASYFGGLLVLVVAILSGLDAFASLLFFVHMIQHLLLLMIVPPLIWLGNPYPFIMWGLPRPLRLRVGRLFAAPSGFRQVLTSATNPFLSWIYLVAAIWVWHDSAMYDLALRSNLAHDLEHLSFLFAGMIFWWHAVGSAPYFRPPMSYLKRIGYVLAAAPPNMALGVAISFAGEPWYQHYLTVPRIWGVSAINDQLYGGVIMWIPGSMMYILAALALVGKQMGLEEKKEPLPHTHWAEAMMAPGLEENGRADVSVGEAGRPG